MPVYQAESFLKNLYMRLVHSLERMTLDFEIVMVEDGGEDNSWSIIEGLARSDNRVKGIKLSRNFGQHQAITAGLDQVSADWVVVMDCDLQDQPEEIVKMYAQAQKGYDIVRARRIIRHDSIMRRASSKIFYALLGYLTETKMDPAMSNFGIYSKKAIDAITEMREIMRFFPVMIQWAGFRSSVVDIAHAKRDCGLSSYTLKKLMRLAFNVIISFSEKPMRLVIKLGFTIASLSIFCAFYLFLRAVFVKQTVLGWSSLIVSIWFLSGLIIFFLGIVGTYVGKVFEQTKKRPLYIIDKTTHP